MKTHKHRSIPTISSDVLLRTYETSSVLFCVKIVGCTSILHRVNVDVFLFYVTVNLYQITQIPWDKGMIVPYTPKESIGEVIRCNSIR